MRSLAGARGRGFQEFAMAMKCAQAEQTKIRVPRISTCIPSVQARPPRSLGHYCCLLPEHCYL